MGALSEGAGQGSTFRSCYRWRGDGARASNGHGAPAPCRSPAAQISVAPTTRLQGINSGRRRRTRRALIDRAAFARLRSDSHHRRIGQRSVEVLARERPDVIISDIGMPKEDGYSPMRRVRKLEGKKGRLPAID